MQSFISDADFRPDNFRKNETLLFNTVNLTMVGLSEHANVWRRGLNVQTIYGVEYQEIFLCSDKKHVLWGIIGQHLSIF